MTDLQHEYLQVATDESDIKSHLPELWETANRLAPNSLIVELGMRYGTSMLALLAGSEANACRVVSYDTAELCKDVYKGILLRHGEPVSSRFTFRLCDSRLPSPSDTPVSLLLVDTLHTWHQVWSEISAWWDKLTNDCFIAFHDTELPEVVRAIEQFMESKRVAATAEFTEVYRSLNSHGMIILQIAKK